VGVFKRNEGKLQNIQSGGRVGGSKKGREKKITEEIKRTEKGGGGTEGRKREERRYMWVKE